MFLCIRETVLRNSEITFRIFQTKQISFSSKLWNNFPFEIQISRKVCKLKNRDNQHTKMLQELPMLASFTLNCQVTMIDCHGLFLSLTISQRQKKVIHWASMSTLSFLLCKKDCVSLFVGLLSEPRSWRLNLLVPPSMNFQLYGVADFIETMCWWFVIKDIIKMTKNDSCELVKELGGPSQNQPS